MSLRTHPLLDIDDAAAYIDRSASYLRRQVQQRRIRHFKVGRKLRFDVRDLDAFLNACAVEPLR